MLVQLTVGGSDGENRDFSKIHRGGDRLFC